jgi:hypothetical protein
MKRLSEKLIASAMFVGALGGTLVVLPLVMDNPALALDAQSPSPDRHFMPPTERVEARIAYVKAALRITDAETAQWNAVADVMRRQAKAHEAKMAAWHDKEQSGQAQVGEDHDGTIIDRLERHQKMMADRASDLAELIAAAKPLYASLTPDQKKAADSLLQGHMGEDHWRPHGPMHGGPDRDGSGPHPE